MANDLLALFQYTGVFDLTPGMLLMWLIGCGLIYLTIAKQYEPLLLLPIGFGILLANLPQTERWNPRPDSCGDATTTSFNGKP